MYLPEDGNLEWAKHVGVVQCIYNTAMRLFAFVGFDIVSNVVLICGVHSDRFRLVRKVKPDHLFFDVTRFEIPQLFVVG
jgi:hypothetical protein